ncbi:MAG: [protein-PII] uridylyltransferase [Thermodesulfovibrionales bacterium]
MAKTALVDIKNRICIGRSGLMLAADHTRRTDEMLRGIFSDLAGAAPIALIATGGYGRAELAPFSDIDIMFFARDHADACVAEKILYALWDRQLDISHSFRTHDECIEEAYRDIRTRTALIESRFVAGDEGLFREFMQKVYPAIAHRKQKDFFIEKTKELEKRRIQSGSSVCLLEPQLKEGEGGLRDVHTIYWLLKVVFRIERFEEIGAVLGPYAYRRLLGAYDFLIRVRYCLHIESGRRNDTLGFEQQKSVAECLGFADTKKFSGAERMMRYYYLKSRIVREAAEQAISLCGKQYAPVLRDLSVRKIGRGFLLSAGKIIPERPDLIPDNADRIIESYAAAARSGRQLSPRMQETIRANLLKISRRSRHSARAIQAFFDILSSGRVEGTLREMHESGVLGRFLPEFGALRFLVVHEPYHLYTVDEHTLIAIRHLEELRTTKYRYLEDLRAIMNRVAHPELLFLALLLHDIGKAVGRHHEEEGYKRLKHILDRFRMDSRKRLRIEFLVRNHILMSMIALRREVSDPAVIARFADTVEDEENLQSLYLMTYADMSAVNPTFWTSWKGILLNELYVRTRDHLLGVQRGREEQMRLLRSLNREAAGEDFSGFIAEMPERYFLATAPEQVVLDHRLVREGRARGCAVRIDAGQGGVAEITVAALDTAGLFARIVGYLSSKGLNIVSGRIFTGSTGVTLDRIAVSNWNAIWWEGLEQEILSGLTDMVVSRRDPALPARPAAGKGPYEVFLELDNESSDAYTLVEVFCPDRMGLLYDIARTLYEQGVDVVSAKITTEAGLAQDVFMVRKEGKQVSRESALDLIANLWNILER